MVNGFKEIGHSGATAGYRAWLAYYPQKKLTIILLSNDGNFPPVTAGHQISEVFLGAEMRKEHNPSPVTLADTDLKKWPGTYRSIRNFDVISFEQLGQQILSNGHALKAIHADTLTLDGVTWAFNKTKGTIMIKNSSDTASYRRVDATIEKDLKVYAGDYYSVEVQGNIKINANDGKLYLSVGPAPASQLMPAYKDAFQLDGDLIEFKRMSRGITTGFDINVSRAEKLPYINSQRAKK
jgi:hypothetical protein